MDLLLALDRGQTGGLRDQLRLQLRSAIQQGRLPAGTLLPSSRTLARDLGVARSVVVEAYEHLSADGYLGSRQGSGTRVLSTAQQARGAASDAIEPDGTLQFIGGVPDPALFPRTEWLRHYRAAVSSLPRRQLGYPGPLGAEPLRVAVTNYVARVRGVAANPDAMLVTTGLTQAIVLVSRALRNRGVDAIAVEDPCFGLHRQAIINAGLRVVPIAVDEHGVDVASLTEQCVGAVLVAPAHSYPTGAVLSSSRRAALVKWASDHDAVIIEDDYDAEFRYDRIPIGALQGLAPERVAYAGCVSKTLSPVLRLGWIVLPSWLIGDVVREKLLDDLGSAVLEQLALARFIDSGGFTRHLRRVRPIYRRRRDATLHELAASMPGAVPTGIDAGLHLYVQLPDWCDESRLVESARARGLLLEGASWHWSAPQSAPPALVLGYGASDESAIGAGIAILGATFRSAEGYQLSIS